jgi:hypothetical protein
MRRVLMTALAGAAVIGLSSPASASVLLTTVNGPNLDVHIKASTTNTQNDNTVVFGSTQNDGQSADVTFTANTAVHITDGAGYAAISDTDGGGVFTAITSNPVPLFNAYQFSIQLVDASFILVQYQLDGSSTWLNALMGDTTNAFAQAGSTLRDYQITGTAGEAINTIRVSTCATSLVSSCNVSGTGAGTGAGIFLFKQNSINLATNPPPPVPEPATWGMMLLGFAGIGMAVRRGRKRTGRLLQIA